MGGTCKWTGPYSSLQHCLHYHIGHYLQCPLQCGHWLDAGNLHQHINTSCTATVICKYCREEMPRCYYKAHSHAHSSLRCVCVCVGCGKGFIPHNKRKEHYWQNCDATNQATHCIALYYYTADLVYIIAAQLQQPILIIAGQM